MANLDSEDAFMRDVEKDYSSTIASESFSKFMANVQDNTSNRSIDLEIKIALKKKLRLSKLKQRRVLRHKIQKLALDLKAKELEIADIDSSLRQYERELNINSIGTDDE